MSMADNAEHLPDIVDVSACKATTLVANCIQRAQAGGGPANGPEGAERTAQAHHEVYDKWHPPAGPNA